MINSIEIKGARVHNLKNIDISIPRDKLVILTGLSGSGKSSLAFDTIFAEGHRRFVESLSSYARMFLGQLDKPDVDSIEGLSPAISIDQKTTSKNPRSTVGTVTEIYDYLRLLYSRLGTVHCPECGKEIKQQSVDQIIDKILTLSDGERFMVIAPVIRGKKGRHEKVIADSRKNGYARVRVDGTVYDLNEDIELELTKKHNIDILVDRLVMKEGIRPSRRHGDRVGRGAHALPTLLKPPLKLPTERLVSSPFLVTERVQKWSFPPTMRARSTELALVKLSHAHSPSITHLAHARIVLELAKCAISPLTK